MGWFFLKHIFSTIFNFFTIGRLSRHRNCLFHYICNCEYDFWHCNWVGTIPMLCNINL